MGQCAMAATEEDAASHAIDKQTHKDRLKENATKKLLLLGTGESGKSTIFKQLTHIYGDGFTEDERMVFVDIIFNNCLSAMKMLAAQADKFSAEPRDFYGEKLDCSIPAELREHSKHLQTLPSDSNLTEEVL